MSIELIISVAIFTLVAAITPGPNNIMIMASGMNYGVRRSLPHFWGICLGFPTMMASVGLGLQNVFFALPILHEIIKVCGIGYLLFLAWKIAVTKPGIEEISDRAPMSFLAAALFQWFNPKAWFMATGGISAFTVISDTYTTQVLIMVLISLIISFPTAGFWLFLGKYLTKLLTSAKHQRIFNITMAILLIGSVTPVIIEYITSKIT